MLYLLTIPNLRVFCLYPRCAGYLFQKVGKIAATAVGGGFLLLQVQLHTFQIYLLHGNILTLHMDMLQ